MTSMVDLRWYGVEFVQQTSRQKKEDRAAKEEREE